MFQRSGTIVTTWERQRRASSKMVDDPVTLRIVLDDKDYAEGGVYLDDMESFDFENGRKCLISFVFSKNVLISRFDLFLYRVEGVFDSKILLERVIIHGIKGNFKSAKITSNGNYKNVSDRVSSLFVINLQNSVVIKKPNVKISKEFKIQL